MHPIDSPSLDLAPIIRGQAVFYGIPSMRMHVACESDVYQEPSIWTQEGSLGEILNDPSLHVLHSIRFRDGKQIRQYAKSLLNLADALDKIDEPEEK